LPAEIDHLAAVYHELFRLKAIDSKLGIREPDFETLISSLHSEDAIIEMSFLHLFESIPAIFLSGSEVEIRLEFCSDSA
jgi:hypothetical protein